MYRRKIDDIADELDRITEGEAFYGLQDQLHVVSTYYQLLIKSLADYRAFESTDRSLFSRFETVHLWLMGTLRYFPSQLWDQVKELFAAHDICQNIAVLSQVNSAQLRRSFSFDQFSDVGGTFGTAISFMRIIVGGTRPHPVLTHDKLLQIRTSLQRASGAISYAATLAKNLDEPFLAPLREHFDTARVPTRKIEELVDDLLSEIHAMPESGKRDALLSVANNVKQELRRPRVSWSLVLTSLIAMLAFVADAKSVFPDAYDRVGAKIEAIIRTVREGAAAPSNNSRERPSPAALNLLPPARRSTLEDIVSESEEQS